MWGERKGVGDVPWQQFFHTADRVIGNQGDDMPRIGFGIEATELGRADQAVQAGSALPLGIRTGEVLFAPDGDRPQRPFGGIVVDLDAPAGAVSLTGTMEPPMIGI